MSGGLHQRYFFYNFFERRGTLTFFNIKRMPIDLLLSRPRLAVILFSSHAKARGRRRSRSKSEERSGKAASGLQECTGNSNENACSVL